MKKLLYRPLGKCFPAVVPLIGSGLFFFVDAQAATPTLSITVPPLERTQQVSNPAPPPEIGLAKWQTEQCMAVRLVHMFLDRSMAGKAVNPLQSLLSVIMDENSAYAQSGLIKAFGPVPNASGIMVVKIGTDESEKPSTPPKKMAKTIVQKPMQVAKTPVDAPTKLAIEQTMPAMAQPAAQPLSEEAKLIEPQPSAVKSAKNTNENKAIETNEQATSKSFEKSGAIIKTEKIHLASDPDAVPPAQDLKEHLTRVIPKFAKEAAQEVLVSQIAPNTHSKNASPSDIEVASDQDIERIVFPPLESARNNSEVYSQLMPAAGGPDTASNDEPLIALPSADTDIVKPKADTVVATPTPPATNVPTPAQPIASATTPLPTVVAAPVAPPVAPAPQAAQAPAPSITPRPVVAPVAPLVPTPQVTPAAPTPAIKSAIVPPVATPVATAAPTPITTPTAAPVAPAPTPAAKKPRRHKPRPIPTPVPQDTTQHVGDSPFVSGSTASNGQREISPESRRILNGIPSGIDQPMPAPPGRLTINRASGPSEALTRPEDPNEVTAKREAMGINIEVKKPRLDVSYELRKAYDAQVAGSSSDAITIYNEILENEPDNTQALLGLATSYHRNGQLERARSLYGRVLAIDRNNRTALNNFMVLLSDESPQEALTQLQSLSQRNPDFAAVPAQMAVVYQKLKDPQKAIESMVRAVQLAPSNLSYRYNLAVLLDRQQNYTQAATLYAQLLEAHDRGETIPGNPDQIQQRLTFIRSNRR